MAGWYLAPSLVKKREQINAAYPGRDKSTDGAIGDAAHNARKSDHNADWNSRPPGIVRALDIDKDLLGKGTGPEVMQALVERIITDHRVAYVIYRRRIWRNPAVYRRGGWHDYTPSGKTGWFYPLDEHGHVSIRHGEQFENDTSPWPIGAPESEEDITMIIYRAAKAGAFGCLAANGQYAILTTKEERDNLVKAGAREVWIEQRTLDALIAESRGVSATVGLRGTPLPVTITEPAP